MQVMNTLLEELATSHIARLVPYQPGKPLSELERELGISDAIKIASNENPLGPSPRAVAAASRALSSGHLYPDAGCFDLRRALCARLAVAPDELVFGAGSNELIYLIVHAFCRPGVDQVLTHKYAFISYRLAAMTYDVEFVEADVTPALACDVDALIASVTPKTRVLFLANPNNPTGSHLSSAEFERLLDGLPERVVVVVDEAYHEYAVAAGVDYPSSASYRSEARPAVITLRTFSKIFGLAGLRVGYALGDRRVLGYIERVRRPFNVNSIGQAAATAALDDDEHVTRSCATARDGIAAISEQATRLGCVVYPSLGNFVLIGVGRDASSVYDQLLRKGVVVRPMAAWGLGQHIRISAGTTDETQRVVAALADVLTT